MYTLDKFKRASTALTGGVWITPDKDFPDIRMRVKAKDAPYFDRLAVAYREHVRQARADGQLTRRQTLSDLPPSVVQRIEDELLLNDRVCEVTGITESKDGPPITVEKFRELALTEDYRPLLDMAREAVQQATDMREDEKERGKGNSSSSSSTAPAGGTRQTS